MQVHRNTFPNFPENTSNCSEIVLNILKERILFLESKIKKEKRERHRFLNEKVGNR